MLSRLTILLIGLIVLAAIIDLNGYNVNAAKKKSAAKKAAKKPSKKAAKKKASIKKIAKKVKKLAKQLPKKVGKKKGLACKSKADIFFALDSSTSLGKKDYNRLKRFIATIMTSINNGNIRGGVVVFSDKAKLHIKLNDNKNDLAKTARQVLSLKYKRGKTATGSAFELIRTIGFEKRYGHRKGVKKIVVVLTDGDPNGPKSAEKQAKKLRDSNVRLVLIGVGPSVNKKKLKNMAGRRGRTIFVKDFNDLGKMKRTIEKILCDLGNKVKVVIKKKKAIIVKKIVVKCRKHCPTHYRLTKKCKCKLYQFKCGLFKKHKKCGKGYGRNKQCKCVRLVVPAGPKCTKKCPKPFVLNKTRCKCVCKRKCGRKRRLESRTCTCSCTIKCRKNFTSDRATCQCHRIQCGLGQILVNKKCRTKIVKPCKKGFLLIRRVCRKIKTCPPGFKKNKFGKCLKVCCRGPCQQDKKLCLPRSCGKNKYVINGSCQKIVKTACPAGSFFNLLAPRCKKTCKEPVQLSFCNKKWKGPGCTCYPGFLWHKGKCVHPDSCPNKPFCLKDTDIMILLDSSISIGKKNFYLMKRFASNLVQQLTIDGGKCHRLSVSRFNHRIETFLHFKSFKKYTHAEMIRIVEAIPYRPGLTYLGEALHRMRAKEWTKVMGMRRGVPRVMFLLSDGTSTNGQLDPYFEARSLREMGVQISIIKLGGQNRKHKKRIFKLAGASGKVFVFGLRHFKEINSLIARVVSFNCKDYACPAPRYTRGPCKNQFQFLDKEEFVRKKFKCVPRTIKNATKRRCACPKVKLTKGQCKKNFQKVTKLSYKFIKSKEICHEKKLEDKVRCSCPDQKLKITKCKDQYEIVQRTYYRLLASYSRGKYCKQRVSRKSRRCACPKTKVKYGKCIAGFRVMSKTFYFWHPKQRRCSKKTREQEVRCKCPKPVVRTKRCANKRVAIKIHVPKLSKKKRCVVDTYVGYEPCENVCPKTADIGFIIDTSSSMKSEDFQLLKTFLVKLVQTFPISLAKTRVTFLTFSSANRIYFINNFLTFTRRKYVIQRLQRLAFYRGATNTGEALRTYRVDGLKRNHGSRLYKHVKQILYLFSDGAANGHVNPITESQKLKALGVRIVVVAIGKHGKHAEFKKIASRPHQINVFHIHNFNQLKLNVRPVSDRRCSFKGGRNSFTVRQDYENRIHELQARNPKVALRKLSGKKFAKLKKLNASDFCRVIVWIKGYYTVIAGKKSSMRRNYLEKFRSKLAHEMRTHKYDIRRLQMTGFDKKKTTRVVFGAPCGPATIFHSAVLNKQFKCKGRNKKYLKFKKVIVVSSSTRHVIHWAHKIDGIVERIVGKTATTIDASKYLKKVRKIRANVDARFSVLHKLAFKSEKRALGLAGNVVKLNLGVMKRCEALIQKRMKKSDKKKMIIKRFHRYLIRAKKYVTRIMTDIALAKLHIKAQKALKNGAGKKKKGGKKGKKGKGKGKKGGKKGKGKKKSG